MTSSFSDKGRAAVLDRPAEISRSEIEFTSYRPPVAMLSRARILSGILQMKSLKSLKQLKHGVSGLPISYPFTLFI